MFYIHKGDIVYLSLTFGQSMDERHPGGLEAGAGRRASPRRPAPSPNRPAGRGGRGAKAGIETGGPERRCAVARPPQNAPDRRRIRPGGPAGRAARRSEKPACADRTRRNLKRMVSRARRVAGAADLSDRRGRPRRGEAHRERGCRARHCAPGGCGRASSPARMRAKAACQAFADVGKPRAARRRMCRAARKKGPPPWRGEGPDAVGEARRRVPGCQSGARSWLRVRTV
jgi:hypothetical protein